MTIQIDSITTMHKPEVRSVKKMNKSNISRLFTEKGLHKMNIPGKQP